MIKHINKEIGFGLFTTKHFKKNERLIGVCGKLRFGGKELSKKVTNTMAEVGNKKRPPYLLDGPIYFVNGNKGMTPNTKWIPLKSNNDYRVGLVVTKDDGIPPNMQIIVDYGEKFNFGNNKR